MATSDGFSWTPESGGADGLPTISAIQPSKYQVPTSNDVVDVIVLGAGYAGLVAARDLATQGKRTLLIEARDRIGGRTYHSTINGFHYEMGGTWVHWHMPHVYREMSLYGMQDNWIVSQTQGGKHDYCSLTSYGTRENIPHPVEDEMFSKVWGTFCNVDGKYMREGMPYPFDSMCNRKEMEKWDKVSCRERLDQIKGQFTTAEIGMLEAVLLQMGGGPLERMGLLDALRWWALGGWTGTGLNDIGLRYRLKDGQSALARKIFDHAVSTGNLAYSFSSPVAKIEDHKTFTIVTCRSGRSWKARRVISTIPLNVLSDISFNPPLPKSKQDAIQEGQVNKCNKVHFDVEGPDLVSWSSFASPAKGLICALADNLTPSNDTHLVAFGPGPNTKLGIPLKDNINGIHEAIDHLVPFKQKVKRIVYHDWYNDEFSKGTWCYYPPNFAHNYLEALQMPFGNIFFASADWSDGWRGWIDGAAQQGMEVAAQVIKDLSSQSRARI